MSSLTLSSQLNILFTEQLHRLHAFAPDVNGNSNKNRATAIQKNNSKAQHLVCGCYNTITFIILFNGRLVMYPLNRTITP
jgi:hypothetical protein